MLSHYRFKNIGTLSVLAFFSLSNVFAQNQMQIKSASPQVIAYASFKDAVNVYEVAQHQAEFDGGLSAFFKYLSDNLKLPTEAQKARADGSVFVSFVVNTDGTISDAIIRRTAYFKRLNDGKTVELDVEKDKSIIESLNGEALRIVKTMPKWKPGRQGTQAVRSVFSMPIAFK
jgi:periplasmic protein TonB